MFLLCKSGVLVTLTDCIEAVRFDSIKSVTVTKKSVSIVSKPTGAESGPIYVDTRASHLEAEKLSASIQDAWFEWAVKSLGGGVPSIGDNTNDLPH